MISLIGAKLAVRVIRSGGSGWISTAQLATMLVDLTKARRALNSDDFEKVLDCYRIFRRERRKKCFDQFTFTNPVRRVVMSFDAIAPFESFRAEGTDWVRRYL